MHGNKASTPMKRRTICRIFALLATPWPLAAGAQSTPFRIAWVSPESAASHSPNFDMFRAGLRDLGYVENRDVVISAWWAEGSEAAIGRMAQDIIRSRPDVVVTGGGLAVEPLLNAGVAIPMVVVVSVDPVVAKLVESFSRPGGHMTGISLLSLDLVPKRIEYLKELSPSLKRLTILGSPDHAGAELELAAARDAAARLGFAHRFFSLRTDGDLDGAFAEIANERADAILAFADPVTMRFAERIARFSIAHKTPAASGWALFAQRGNLMAYGPVINETYRRIAVYVDKIRRGAKAGDLPIELPTKVELVLNRKTAQALGIAIPQSLLSRADQLIDS